MIPAGYGLQAIRKDLDKEFGWEPPEKRPAATFGLPKGRCKPQCPLYLKKHSGEEIRKMQQTSGSVLSDCPLPMQFERSQLLPDLPISSGETNCISMAM